ncbi:MAG: STAS domain-containing protein [Pseudomonadota bacterium]
MNLRSEHRDGLLEITVEAERIDAASAIQFKDRMRELTREGPDRVVLDMAEVDFIDSSGLGAIVSAMKGLDGGKRLQLAALSPKVLKVLRLTRMDSVFTIYASIEAARQADADAA